MPSYDAIAKQYRDSKLLPFRHAIERYTVFRELGDLRGRTVLDLACGEGIYARQFMRAGAAAVTGVDISRQMVALAEAAEQSEPLGCRYVCADAALFVPASPAFDNYYLEPSTYEDAMRDSGFVDFRWIDAALDPAARQDRFWDLFLNQQPLAAFAAARPR